MRQFKPGQLQTGSLYNISSSYALTASFATNLNPNATASYAINAETASYVNPLRQNVQITGSLYFPDNTHSIYFSGSGAASRLTWNDTDGTLDLGLKGGNVTLQVGQEEVIRVVNKTGADLLESQYRAVRIRSVGEGGAQGQRLAVVLAQADNDANSATTIGIVTENITNNQEGFITTFGKVRGIDTTGTLQGETWVDGDMLYLSPNTPGYITNIKPQAPQHTVILGYVVYAHQNQGSIFVKVDNGYEIDELHNVRITTSSLSSGDLLVYSGSVWTNTKQLTGSYGLTGSISTTTGFLHNQSLDSTNRILYDSNGVESIQWRTRALVNINGGEALNWDDSDNVLGIRTIPTSEQLSQQRINDQLSFSELIANGKIVTEQQIEQDARINGTIVYYNGDATEWQRLEGSVIINSEPPVDNILGIVIEQESGNILLQGNITFKIDNGVPSTGFPPVVGAFRDGDPLYLTSGGEYTTPVSFSIDIPDGAVRSMGHILQSVTEGGLTSGIISFNPSNNYFRKISGISRIDQINGQGIYAQYAVTADQAVSSSFATSASFATTASFVRNAVSASNATSALTASFIQSKTVFNQPILGTGNIGFVSRSFSPSIGSNSTGETQLLQLPIPANTFSTTDKLSFFAVFSKVGAASAFTVRVKITTSPSMPAGNTSQIAQSANTTAATLYFKISRDLFISSGSLFGVSFTNSTITDTIASVNSISSVAFDVTQTQYVYVSAIPTTTPTADVIRLEAFEIKNI